MNSGLGKWELLVFSEADRQWKRSWQDDMKSLQSLTQIPESDGVVRRGRQTVSATLIENNSPAMPELSASNGTEGTYSALCTAFEHNHHYMKLVFCVSLQRRALGRHLRTSNAIHPVSADVSNMQGKGWSGKGSP